MNLLNKVYKEIQEFVQGEKYSIIPLGSYSKNENKHLELDGEKKSLSDLEFIIIGNHSIKIEDFIYERERYYSAKYGEYFKIDFGFIKPGIRLLFLRNRVLFFEGYSNYEKKFWQFDFVISKKIDLIECRQALIWRAFSLKTKLKNITNNDIEINYFIARNILDLVMIYSYTIGEKLTTHRERVKYFKHNQTFCKIFPIDMIIKAYKIFNSPQNHDLSISYEEFYQIYVLLCDYLNSKGYEILHSPLRRMIYGFLQKKLRILDLFQMNSKDLILELKFLASKESIDERDIQFIDKYVSILPYLENYR